MEESYQKRALRVENLQIPLNLQPEQGEVVACQCENISTTGALLRLTDGDKFVTVGERFQTRLLDRGQWVDVWLRVERVDGETFAVQFERALTD